MVLGLEAIAAIARLKASGLRPAPFRAPPLAPITPCFNLAGIADTFGECHWETDTFKTL
jgi:hypothetical protein